MQGELDVFEANANTVIHDILNGASNATLKQDVQALDASFVQLARGEERLVSDELQDGNADAARAHQRQLDAVEDVFEEIGRLLRDRG